ncbi:nucleotide-binding protein [Vibrio parahaemolyticus]|uniref:TIR domain-containing protein n=1 Tax=Vibrio parahaemolyticus TaxID=670 RepID=UPI0004119CDE|nr:nucleotide-binding protein [Vibrio parahaemolyticus]EGQ7830722.1 nucleotide-binding protein [Vibrio parahaemolyticus]EGR3259780.1 nucleotide-binding protein [Vibrio parahaemolyticus]EJG2057909.1 nucleotide-binding protein [Vibrio parahaemolyticus]KOY27300.1 nucleotide-binding protein [Vibrio parahaemolyticus]KYY10318.1 nucleotide-binding protein [Vibrio parahaemolyticus]
MTQKPTVFIASSVEAISVAEAVNIKMEYDAQVKQWDNAFDLSSITITSLIERAKKTDYGIFVFHPDDKTTIRQNEYSSVRDNVLFELGLFIGALGIERCFVLIPKSTESSFRMPTDLAGVTTTTYDDSLDDMVDAVTTSCAKIKQAIKKLEQSKPSSNPNPVEDSVVTNLQTQLNASQSKIWSMGHELERSKENEAQLIESIKSQFFSIAKPATPAEIKRWEDGAKESYLQEVKIRSHNAYYVDQDIVLPPLYGASSLSVIVEKGVKVHGLGKSSHNDIYYLDGFRTDRRV